MKKPNEWLRYDKKDGRKGRGKKARNKATRKYSVTEALKQMAEFEPSIPIEYIVASRKAARK